VAEPSDRVVGGDSVERFGDGLFQGFRGAGFDRPQVLLELEPGLLNLKSEVEACDSSFLGTWERG